MLLSPLAIKALNSIEKIETRIIISNFDGNHITTIISYYIHRSSQRAIFAKKVLFFLGATFLIVFIEHLEFSRRDKIL